MVCAIGCQVTNVCCSWQEVLHREPLLHGPVWQSPLGGAARPPAPRQQGPGLAAQVSCDWRRAGHVTTVLTSDWSGGGTCPRPPTRRGLRARGRPGRTGTPPPRCRPWQVSTQWDLGQGIRGREIQNTRIHIYYYFLINFI